MPVRVDAVLRAIYYDASHPAGYGSAVDLLKAAKLKRKNIKLSDVLRWLESQDSFTLHRRIIKKFPRRKFISKGLNHIWQADLIDMSAIKKENKGMTFLLTCIDLFSRQAYARAIKTKRPIDVIKAFKQILKQASSSPTFLHTDRGSEFTSKAFQECLNKQSIKWYSTYNQEIKASLVERFHRTLKNRMFRYFTAKNTLHYLKVLPELLSAYNKRQHRTLGMAPADVTRKNEKQLWEKQYGKYLQKRKKMFRYKINDTVRITKMKKQFQRGYTRGWKREKFHIIDRYSTTPPTYKIADLDGEVLEGTFYEQELGRVSA